MLNDYQIKGHTVWHTPCLAWAKDFSTNKSRVWAAGAGPHSARLCFVSWLKENLQDASLIFSYLETVSAPRHVTYTVFAGRDTPPWPIVVPALTLTLHSASIINTDTLSHKLQDSQTFCSRGTLREEWRLTPGEPDLVWALIGDTGFLLGVHDVISRPLSRPTRNFEEFFVFQTVMKIWGFNNWTFRQKMKVPHQIIYNETLRTTASLHIWILFSEFINLGGWLQRKIKFLST